MEGKSETAARVFYDGSCPICSREIGFYQKRSGAEKIDWVDVSRAEAGEVVPGLTKASALERLHVMNSTGALVSGGAAFTLIWSRLPGFAWLAGVFERPFMARILERAYDGFLALRRGRAQKS